MLVCFAVNSRYWHPSLPSVRPSPSVTHLIHSSLRLSKTISLPSSPPFFPLQLCFFRAPFPFVVMASSSSTLEDTAISTESLKTPFSVLFVCLGNICRSPAAEAVFTEIVRKRGLESKFKIDSAGTIGYHEGNPADSRMRAAAKKRGIEVTSISRPVRSSDFRDFDLILAMDMKNRDDLVDVLERWSQKEKIPKDAYRKVKLMCSYCRRHSESEVLDPYYGGPQGFEKVLDILEDSCEALLDCIVSESCWDIPPQ